MPSFLRPTVERTLRHCHPHNWARHVLSSYIATATFSSSPSPDTVSTKAHSKQPSVLERNKLQDYLDLVKSSKEPTAEDIERHRPPKHAPPGNRQYEIDYEGLVLNLSRSFTVKQLQKAHEFFDLECPRRRSKRDLAVSIIERHWNWPSLSDSMKQRKDRTEIISQTFPLDTREAFLLLGKDGSNLHMLSRKYNVRTSFVSSPLSLAVKGVRGSVERLARYITTFKTDIAENLVQFPTAKDVTLELCQRVSRLSGALVESQDKQTFRVTYNKKEPRASHIAKALMVRGAFESSDSPPLLACTSKDRLTPSSGGLPRGISLYPFIPTRSLPWNVDNGGIFRMRDVGRFDYNEMKRTAFLSHDHLTMDDDGKIEDLRKRLIGVEDAVRFEKTSDSFQASFGHLLLCVPSTASNVLTPPITGNSSMLELLQEMKHLEKQQVFMPSIPKHLLGSKPHRQRLVHRLVYHATPRHERDTENTANSMSIESIKLEFGHNFSSATAATEGYMNTDDDSVAETDDLPNEDEETLNITESGFWRGTQSLVDLVLPERAMDLQFHIANFKETPESYWPIELREYKETIHELSVSSLNDSQANLPLIFSDNGTTFVLKSSTLIRQSTDHIHVDKMVVPSQVVNESILDLNSNERYLTCKVACEDPSSDKSWEQFLHACDSLTAHATQNHS